MASVPLSNDTTPTHLAAEFVAEKVAHLHEIAEALAGLLSWPRGDAAPGRPASELYLVPSPGPSTALYDRDLALRVAKQAVAVRRSRERSFGEDLFADPAWEVLIDLFIAQVEGKDVTIGDACIAASVPLTSALRCCQALHSRKLVRREADQRDKRRVLLRLTNPTFDKMIALLLEGTVARHGADASRSVMDVE